MSRCFLRTRTVEKVWLAETVACAAQGLPWLTKDCVMAKGAPGCHVGNGAGAYARGRAGRPQRIEGKGCCTGELNSLSVSDNSRDNAARSRSKDAHLPLALSAAATSPLLRCETDTRACARAWNGSRGRPRVKRRTCDYMRRQCARCNHKKKRKLLILLHISGGRSV